MPDSKFDIDEITLDSQIRYKIDSELAKIIEIDSWCSFKEITLGFLKFNKKTKGDFYDRESKSFNAYKYPYFMQFFPYLLDYKHKKDQRITNLDLR